MSTLLFLLLAFLSVACDALRLAPSMSIRKIAKGFAAPLVAITLGSSIGDAVFVAARGESSYQFVRVAYAAEQTSIFEGNYNDPNHVSISVLNVKTRMTMMNLP